LTDTPLKRAGARLYFDEDAHGRLAQALRSRGHDVETTLAASRLEALDDDQLAFAVSLRRVLVTHNVKDFPRIHAEWLAQGRTHAGIVVLVGAADVGTMLRRMETLLARFSADELKNGLFYLGAEYDG
jgi:hypothetical protein